MASRSKVNEMSCQLDVKSKRCHVNQKSNQRDFMSIEETSCHLEVEHRKEIGKRTEVDARQTLCFAKERMRLKVRWRAKCFVLQ